MRATPIVFGLLFASLLLCGFHCRGPARQNVAAIAGTSHCDKPDYATVERVFNAVAKLIESRGFKGYLTDEPSSYQFPGGWVYTRGFWSEHGVGCTIQFSRKFARVEFYEYEVSKGSGVFRMTNGEREQIRLLTESIAERIRAELPKSYEIQISYSKGQREPQVTSH